MDVLVYRDWDWDDGVRVLSCTGNGTETLAQTVFLIFGRCYLSERMQRI